MYECLYKVHKCHDEEWSVHPSTSMTRGKNAEHIHAMILDNRRVALDEVMHSLCSSHDSDLCSSLDPVHKIILLLLLYVNFFYSQGLRRNFSSS